MASTDLTKVFSYLRSRNIIFVTYSLIKKTQVQSLRGTSNELQQKQKIRGRLTTNRDFIGWNTGYFFRVNGTKGFPSLQAALLENCQIMFDVRQMFHLKLPLLVTEENFWYHQRNIPRIPTNNILITTQLISSCFMGGGLPENFEPAFSRLNNAYKYFFDLERRNTDKSI